MSNSVSLCQLEDPRQMPSTCWEHQKKEEEGKMLLQEIESGSHNGRQWED